MKISLVLLVGVIAVTRAATGRYDVITEGPNDFPATHPTVLESSSVAAIRDNKQGQLQHSQDLMVTVSPTSHDFQRDSNLFLSHNIGTPASTTSPSKSSVKGQFNEISSQNSQSFFNDKQSSQKQHQFTDGRQQHPGQNPQSFFNDKQSSQNQQQFNDGRQQQFNDGRQQQFNDGRQQQFNDGRQQQFNDGRQQQFNDGRQQQFNDGRQQQFNDGRQQQFNDGRQQHPGQNPFSFNDNQQALNEPRFYNAEQEFPSQDQFVNDRQQQQFYNDQQENQQFYNDQQSPIQQQFYNDNQQSMNHQQQFFSDKQQTIAQQQPRDQREMFNVKTAAISGQQLNSKRLIQDISSHKGSAKGAEPSIQIHSVSKGAVQLSAFDNRAQPIGLPQSAAVHSSSVVVSGLKGMPLLPAMVYNGGAVPMTHAAVYSRDPLYKGGAAMRQHLQTPFVRYVYSHVL